MTSLSDFGESDYEAVPIIPAGTYRGSVQATDVDEDKAQIVIAIALNGNGGMLSDGKTLVDGSVVKHRLFLPREEDEVTPTASGKQTKAAWKKNTLIDFMKDNGITPVNRDHLLEVMSTGEFCGRNVKITTELEPYQGQVMERVKTFEVV